MMCKTTDSQDLKLKREDKSLVFEIITQQQIAIYCKSISGMPVVDASLTLSFLRQTQYVSCSKSETIV